MGTARYMPRSHAELPDVGANTHPQIDTALTDNSNKWGAIEQYGFVNRSQTTLSFNDSNYTLTLGDAGSGWSYMRDGVLCAITGDKTVVLPGSPPTAGVYYIFIDDTSGTLTASTNAWNLTDTKVPVAILIWNNSATPKFILLDERHTCTIERSIHRLWHVTRGTQFISGGVPSGQTVGVGNSDTALTMALSQAVIADEDIWLTLPALADGDGTTANYSLMYRTAATTWAWERGIMPYRYSGAGTGSIEWDSGGTMTPANTSNRFVNYYLLMTNAVGNSGVSSDWRFVLIPGRSLFTSLATAQAEDVTTFSMAGFPFVEYVWCYRFTYNYNASNTTKGDVSLAATPQRLNISGAQLAVAPAPASVARVVSLKVIDDATPLTTGDGKASFAVPALMSGMNLIDAAAHVTTGSTSGNPTVQLRRKKLSDDSVADMLTTRITIDAHATTPERDSVTAATAAVIDTANDDVSTGDEIYVDVDVAGTGTKGLEVRMTFATP